MSNQDRSLGEYAAAGVNYAQLSPFKALMRETARRTQPFAHRRGMAVVPLGHGVMFRALDDHRRPRPVYGYAATLEGLGNKSWIADWMSAYASRHPTDRTYYEGIGQDTALMAVNDLIAHGALPFLYADEVAVGDSGWFGDERRSRALAESFFRICSEVSMTLGSGETPALKYLLKPEPPVPASPSLSGCATGVLFAPPIIRKHSPGDRIIGVTSSGIHANGISLVIKRAMGLPDAFLTKLPNGNTLGSEALIPTWSYVRLVEALLAEKVDIKGLLPGTGGGVAKLAAYDEGNFTYRIHTWVPAIPPLFQYMRELGVSTHDCLTTFNWGVGYYIFVSPKDVNRVIDIGTMAGYELCEVGVVEPGFRRVIFEPEGNIILQPPEDG